MEIDFDVRNLAREAEDLAKRVVIESTGVAALVCFLNPVYFSWRSVVRYWKDRRALTNSAMPRLPPELWTIILQSILEPYSHPYKYCSSSNFPAYAIRQMDARFRVDEEQTALREDYQSIRLVCKEWAAISRSFHIMFYNNQPHKYLQGVKKLKIRYGAKELSHVLLMPLVTSHLTQIVLHNERPTKYPSICPTDLLLDRAKCLPELRSLSLLNTGGNPQDFWARLQQSFPLLVSLTITDLVQQPGTFTMHQLEILDIKWTPIVTFELPALKHCCLRREESRGSGLGFQPCLNHLVSFLSSNGSKLESLLIPRGSNPITVADGGKSARALWDACPNLQTLILVDWYGFHDGLCVPPENRPPLWHPIQNLALCDHWTRETLEARFESLSHILSALRITHLLIEHSALAQSETLSIQEFCHAEGVRLSRIPENGSENPRYIYQKWVESVEFRKMSRRTVKTLVRESWDWYTYYYAES